MPSHSPWEFRKVFLLHLIFGALTTVAVVAGIAILAFAPGRSLHLRDLPGLWPFALLVYSIFLHAAIARGAWQRKSWVFEKSVDLGMLLMLAAPFGIFAGITILISHWKDRSEIGRRPPQVPLTDAWPDSAARKAGSNDA